MATLVLSAAGMALGGSIGGSVLGLSMATIGRAAGATLGRVIDQRLLGSGSEPVETGRVDRFRLTTASEGTPIARVFGRMRVPGQVIWASRFKESSTTTGGGKGSGPQPATTTFSYSVSLAIALCEGEITRVGRVWADGVEIATDTLGMRVYAGTETQPVDPKMEAVEGIGNVPAYRGLAYVVMEDLQLDQFGNRVPQFTFEVMRPDGPEADPAVADIARQVQAVALIPGTGEYSLATTPAYLDKGLGEVQAVNVNSPMGGTDFLNSITALNEELPECSSALLVVSWFGDDLRCGECQIKPKVEQVDFDAENAPWSVSGTLRAAAETVPLEDGRPVYGGTPSDASVIEAIQEMASRGIETVFYPFILMEQLDGNTLPDPYSDATAQPALPWRGRITLNKAPWIDGTADQTAAAEAQVNDFMGDASVADFSVQSNGVAYTGSDTWRYRRFILHYANLCKAAGGVSAFCIGSEMRGLTQIRGAGGTFPAVEAMRQLAADVRTILGPETKITYAADWSEYHGYQPRGTADKIFHLDALWADPNIDFIGIDNYMPLSDWREGDEHADAEWGSIYNLDYLQANIAGGEGYDWFYHSQEARDAQIRTPITDGQGEPWIWRYKDLVSWWGNTHHNRIGGVRAENPTDWIPESKPFWFTEFGCAAIDKGTNQPNKFLDPKSSESSLPYFSNGARDDVMQMQYLRAMYRHFGQTDNNPASTVYDGPMLDMSKAHVWAWDARPFPQFPASADLWSDGDNYARGHWLNGRSSSRTLASVVAEICEASSVRNYDVSELYGIVRGYQITDVATARSALQPLLMAYGIEAIERDGVLKFFNRENAGTVQLEESALAYDPERETELSQTRSSSTEGLGRVQVGFLDADADYEAAVSEASHPDERNFTVSRSEFPMALLRTEGARIADRWVHEARTSRDSITFGLPPSQAALGVGDVVEVGNCQYRIDQIEEAGIRLAEATGVSQSIYQIGDRLDEVTSLPPYIGPTPVQMLFMDLPMLPSDTEPQQPYIPTIGRPWPGTVAIYGSNTDSGYILQNLVKDRSVMGQTLNTVPEAPIGIWDRQGGIDVRLANGTLQSADPAAVLSGSNILAIGDGSPAGWEIIQYTTAELIDLNVYRLSGLLRGQFGSDVKMRAEWPVGSYVVSLDALPEQITIPTASRGLPRHLRYGPASRPLGDPTYRYAVESFFGEGWRPYSVGHLRSSEGTGGTAINWIRRTRVEGDAWRETEVPLGEAEEAYVVEVRQGGQVLRQSFVGDPMWIYDTADQATDLGPGSYEVAVAQISDRYGTGPFKSITVAA